MGSFEHRLRRRSPQDCPGSRRAESRRSPSEATAASPYRSSMKPPRVRQYPLVVEGERASLGKTDPSGSGGIVVSRGTPSPAADQERHGGRGFPWVPVRPGIHSDDLQGVAGQSGLLPEFANEGFLDRFPELDEPSRERPEAPERRVPPTYQEHPSRPNPHRVHGQRGVLVSSAHSCLETDRVLGFARSPRRTESGGPLEAERDAPRSR